MLKNKVIISLYSIHIQESRKSTAEVLHHWNVRLLRVCGFSREAVLTSCIPAYLGRKVRVTVVVIIDLHLYIEFTKPKGIRVKAPQRVLFAMYMTILISKVRNRSPFHQSYVRKLLNPLEKRKLDGSSFTSPNKR